MFKNLRIGKSAAKPEKERSTTIPKGSTLKRVETGNSITYSANF